MWVVAVTVRITCFANTIGHYFYSRLYTSSYQFK